MNESILLFTYEDTTILLCFGGSQSWKINYERAKKAKYLVCVRNCDHPLSEEKIGHRTAFFVGKITGLRRPFSNQYAKRWMIEFDEYSEIESPNMWAGWQNPVKYIPTDKIDIDFKSLNFKTAPERDMNFINEYLKKHDSR